MDEKLCPEIHRERRELERDIRLLRRLGEHEVWDIERLWNLIDDGITVLNFQRCSAEGWIQLRRNRVVDEAPKAPSLEHGKWHSPMVSEWAIHFPNCAEDRERRRMGVPAMLAMWEWHLDQCAAVYFKIAGEKRRGYKRPTKAPPMSAKQAAFEGLKRKCFKRNSAAPFEVRISEDGRSYLEAEVETSEVYRPATFFRMNGVARLRKAAAKGRKSKRVRSRNIDGVVCYCVSDVDRWWPELLPAAFSSTVRRT